MKAAAVFAIFASVVCQLASAKSSGDLYVTFDRGVVVNTFQLHSNNSIVSVTKYNDKGFPEGAQAEGAVALEDMASEIKALIELVKSFMKTGFTVDGANQLIQAINDAVKSGFANAKDASSIIAKIQELMKNGGSVTGAGDIISVIQTMLQEILKLIDAQPIVCRRRLIGRGVGKLPEQKCLAGEDAALGLCYPSCKAEFEASMGFVCRKKGCGGVAGSADIGISCSKPAAYGRGTGFVVKAKCEGAGYDTQGCEQNGLLWYPKCKAGFRAFGCCLCTPECPAGTRDDGAFCRKESYVRTGTNRAECGAGLEKNAGLCYPQCEPNQDGLGPICSPQCAGDAPSKCGLFCTSTPAACAGAMVEIVGDGTKILLSAITADFTGVIKAAVQLGKYLIQMRRCT